MNNIKDIIHEISKSYGISKPQSINLCLKFFNEFDAILYKFTDGMDYNAFSKYAHMIKGTSANLRISEIYNIAGDLEVAAKARDVGKCDSCIGKIKQIIERLNKDLCYLSKIGNIKVLIVEDDITTGTILEKIVINLGYQVIGLASTPEEALLLAKQEKPEIILLDINLSASINGIFIGELLSKYYECKIVYISISVDPTIINQAKDHGVAYISKPFTATEIEEVFNNINFYNYPKIPLNNNSSLKIRIKEDNKIFFVNYENIIYIESQGHLLLLYTDNKVYAVRESLKEILNADDRGVFIQTHRSFLVNRNEINDIINTNYSYSISLKHLSKEIPIGKKFLKSLLK